VDVEPLYERLLVIRSQLGDQQAFAELVDLYGPRLRYFVRKFVGPSAAAEDLVQEVWLAVFRALPRLAAAEAFRTWLYRIARDQSLGLLRRERRLPRTMSNGEAISEAVDEAAIEFGDEDIAAVHQGLDALPAEQREALVLRFLEDMSYDEIARITGVPVGTVRSRLFYGKQALGKNLKGNER
jgi:RNA polymerase sigma-70 factor (ECF subfamily)